MLVKRHTVEKTTHKKRILFISRAYRSNAGGMERLSFEFINELRNHPEIEASMVTYSGQRKWFPLYFTVMLPKILRMALTVDAVHLGDPLLADIGWLIKKLWCKPIAVTVHGLDVSFPNPFFRAYQKLFFTNLDLYLPISQHAKHLLDAWDIQGRVQVVHPGVSDRFYDVSRTRLKLSEYLGFSTENKTVLLTVGRLVRRKGHEWFIRNVLPKLSSNSVYVIAGSGPELVAISKAAVEADVASQVTILGRVSDADLKLLYNTVDAFIQPNVRVAGDAEGFGLVLLEAALCGRRVIASDVDGIPDAITHGRSGTLLPAEDSEAWIAALSKELATIPGQREYVLDTYGWKQQANRYATALLATKGDLTI